MAMRTYSFSPQMRQIKPAVTFISAVIVSLLSGCATEQQPIIIVPSKPAQHITGEIEGNFCMTGTKTNLGGIAYTPNLYQHAIGKCKHPTWKRENIIMLYFGDDGSQAPKPLLDEELDRLMHPDNYLTPKEIAELDCAENSECKANDLLLKKGIAIHFDVDSDVPANQDEIALVERIARVAKTKRTLLAVTGHADSTATDEHNVPLSIRRAEAIEKLLRSHGLDRQLIVATGRSSTEPVATNETIDGRAKNRRVEIVKKFTQMVTGADGNGN